MQIHMKTKYFFIFLFLLGLTVNATAQQSENGLTSVLKAYKITTAADGNEVATEVTEVTPGDLIEYRLTYTNATGGDISQLQPVLPIPLQMFYLGETASPELSGASVSPTANDFSRPPLTRQVQQPDGSTTTETIPAEEYRRIQWLVPAIAAGESITLTARVRVRS